MVLVKLLLVSFLIMYIRFISIFATRVGVVRRSVRPRRRAVVFVLVFFWSSRVSATRRVPIASPVGSGEQADQIRQVDDLSVAGAGCHDEADTVLVKGPTW